MPGLNIFQVLISNQLTNNLSDMRQIPDHQEVFLDRNGFASIIFEINEYVSKGDHDEVLDDHQALLYHFDDIVSGTNDIIRIESSGLVSMPNLP